MTRNIFEYPINVNGKLQEIILNLLHQKKINNEEKLQVVFANIINIFLTILTKT